MGGSGLGMGARNKLFFKKKFLNLFIFDSGGGGWGVEGGSRYGVKLEYFCNLRLKESFGKCFS